MLHMPETIGQQLDEIIEARKDEFANPNKIKTVIETEQNPLGYNAVIHFHIGSADLVAVYVYHTDHTPARWYCQQDWID